jgi:hypothetical protein
MKSKEKSLETTTHFPVDRSTFRQRVEGMAEGFQRFSGEEKVNLSILEGAVLEVRGGRLRRRRSGWRRVLSSIFKNDQRRGIDRRRPPAYLDGPQNTVVIIRLEKGALGPDACGRKIYFRVD